MSSLILNFDWDSSAKDSIHPQSKQTVGSWTQKLKQKKLAKHRQKLRNKDAPLPIEDDSQPDLQQQQPEEYHPASQPQTAPRKKLKLDATAFQPTPSRFQIISSLFSSTIIPTIKPHPNHEPSSMVVYAPSNASLSQIKITSPSLNLHPQISEQLHSSPKLGSIHSPTSIQSIAWPLLSSQSNHSNRDVIIQSETGSGKTLAYLVPIIQDLLTLPLNRPEVSWNREIGTLAIILVPTRELAEQVYHVAINLLSFTQKNRSDPENLVDATCAPEYAQEESPGSKTRPFRLNPRWLVPGTLHGGTNRSHEKARLRRGLPLLVCTPGRLLDHLEKTVSLRMAGETKNVPTTNRTKSNSESVASNLKLRWLVVDEADRLMDMGFEEQMSGILKHLKQRETNKQDANSTPIASHPNSHSRRTILCSATIPDGVKKLVGMSLNDPILLKATGPPSSEQEPTQANNDSTQESVDQSDNNAKFAAPSQLSQYYVITPSKLRLVSLIALLRQITSPHQKKPAEKILVFMSCTASVDFHFEAIGNILTNDDDEHAENQKNAHDDGKNKRVKTDPRKPASSTTSQVNRSPILRKSNLIPGVNIYRLHGSLDLQTRLKSLNKFSDKTQGSAKTNSDRETRVANPSILFCTSLAGRGLDVPFVSHVIQYDLPTEGGVTEYLHRIGRTARAGLTGQAWSFLLPTESGWIDWCEANQNHHQDHTSTHHRVPKLKQIDVQNLLSEGFAAKSQKEWEARATDTQMSIEKWVLQSEKNRNLASIGFMSHIRAYTTHPTKEKMFFNLKNLHLGHLAKSFGLREPPKNLSSYGTTTKNNSTPASDNKRVNKRKNDTQDLQTMISDDDDEDFDNSKLIKKPINFFPLTQSIKTSHSLKGPLGNSIDEFNLG